MKRRAFLLASLLVQAGAQEKNELRFCLRADPKTFDPLKVEEESSGIVRYLTGGVLIRVHRQTQNPIAELATSWKRSADGRRISFALRRGVHYSDGTPFDAEDVAYTFRMLADPNLRSPAADSFRFAQGAPRVEVKGRYEADVVFPAPAPGAERLFDSAPILSSRSPKRELAVLGPYELAEHKPGVHVLLRRNPHYWKKDEAGVRLPYVDTIRMEIQQNRELEMMRFRRGQLSLISSLDAEMYEQLAAQMPSGAVDGGPSLDAEFLWFNQIPGAGIDEYKKSWFRSARFRQAVSRAISRDDLCRVVYKGRAQPAAGPVSPSNRFWYNAALKPHSYDPPAALRLLAEEGFQLRDGVLRDRTGNATEFSLITNAGNRARERMGAMIQQDLAKIGIKVNLVTLDFRSLIERITRGFQYEACLLGLVNTDLDPNSQMNVWLSSGSSHQWNPNQKRPETAWEADIDRLMDAQATALDPNKRKTSFDRVQQIVFEQAPFIYLVHKNALGAVSPALRNARASALWPQILWNAERFSLGPEVSSRGR